MAEPNVLPEAGHAGGVAICEVAATRIDADGRRETHDHVAEETPVAMVYNGRSHAVMMATPADLEDFALGFALTEGVIGDPAECEALEIHQGGDGIELRMRIPDMRVQALGSGTRNLVGRTGCGLCGADALATAIRPVPRVARMPVRIDALRSALHALQSGQRLNATCHGLHAAAFVSGETMLLREDVGRHNALDKALGARVRAGHERGFVVVTSRASFELVHKTAQAGISLLAAISAPTALAIRLAERAGMTLVAFLRGSRMSVYAHGDRLVESLEPRR